MTEATSATRIAGRVATRLNRPTIRTCSRAAAAPREPRADEALGLPRHHADEKQDEEPLSPRTDRTTSCVGTIGVAPARMRNVASADHSAAITVSVPIQPGPLGCGSQDAGVLAAALVDLVQDNAPDRVTGIRCRTRCGCMTTTLWSK